MSHVQIRWTVCFRTKQALSAYSMNAPRTRANSRSLFPRFQPNLSLLSIVSTFRTRSGIIDDRSTLLPILPSSFFFFLFSPSTLNSSINFRRGRLPLLRYPRLTSSFSLQHRERGGYSRGINLNRVTDCGIIRKIDSRSLLILYFIRLKCPWFLPP